MAKVCSSPQLALSPRRAEQQQATCRELSRRQQPQQQEEQPAEVDAAEAGSSKSLAQQQGAAGRRNSGTGKRRGGPDRSFGERKRSHTAVTPRNKFLFGGTRRDPLNLSSITESKGSTPRASPQATPQPHNKDAAPPAAVSKPVRLDSRDPLGLLADLEQDNRKSRPHKRRRQRRSAGQQQQQAGGSRRAQQPDERCVSDSELKATTSPGSSSSRRSRSASTEARPPKRLRTQSAHVVHSQEKETEPAAAASEQPPHEKAAVTSVEQQPTAAAASAPVVADAQQQPSASANANKNHQKKDRFRFGNYDRYYGKRLSDKQPSDPRLDCLDRQWFSGKAVLDVGCNAGLVTVHAARQLAAAKAVGIDIDHKLVAAARKHLSTLAHKASGNNGGGKYPPSFGKLYGALEPPGASSSQQQQFPHNCSFMQANYVLDDDAKLQMVRPEYDVILALSITKWVHLNWGDAGLKRFFRRAFANLRPGGCLIVEPQPFDTYKKRLRMSEELKATYQSIKFTPEMFTDFLLNDVGFTACHKLTSGQSTSANKGFQRPIYRFVKPPVAAADASNTTG